MALERALQAMERNSLRLDIGGAASGALGATRFGGMPDVPPDFLWPVFETAAYDSEAVRPRPLSFLAQFNCAGLAPLDSEGLLPKHGLLSFFYELDSQRWGFDPKDAGCARVFWFPETDALAPAAFPIALSEEHRLPAMGITLTAEPSWPGAEDFCSSRGGRPGGWEDYFEARAQLNLREPENRSCLLGWPDVLQDTMFQACELVGRGYFLGGGREHIRRPDAEYARLHALEDWMLLFQLDTVSRGDFELMFGDCGRLYFYIRRKDLMARRFDRVWLILQCS